jgi:hypothetical protein
MNALATQDLSSTKAEELCLALLTAEDESAAVRLLDSYGYSLDTPNVWHPLGDNEGNFGQVGNQQDEGTPALVEKIVNSIDAVLMGECYAANVQPDSPSAPQSMQQAVERFFGIKDGRLGALDSAEQKQLAERILVVATGEKSSPCYLIIDTGEGQSPHRFRDTFLSVTQGTSPKVRIPFVQGKFNAGSTGSLQYCGKHNIQLIVSRRQPYAPVDQSDGSADRWGFTVIRRRRPQAGDRSSVFEYLAPKGEILNFASPGLQALPGKTPQAKNPLAYQQPLTHGTCIKLYNYRWRGRGLATLEARRELENYLQVPCLPFRVVEARNGYKANYFATTVIGVWNAIGEPDEETGSKKVEAGFPASGELNVPGIGKLPYQVVVWRDSLNPDHLTTGLYFLQNGQVHGSFPTDFVSRTLGFDYIKDHVLIAVDCTAMDRGVAEDLFMTSRDRLRKNEEYAVVRTALTSELRDHPGLRAVNAEWRERRREKAADSKDEVQELLNELIKKDPGLAKLFGIGGIVVSPAGPGAFQKFEGRKFPSYFRIEKEPKTGLVKHCPINKTVRVDFETDAENMYFSRANERGELQVEPTLSLVDSSHLWNGKFTVQFRVPWDAKPGDKFPIRVTVSDIAHAMPFVCELQLVAEAEAETRKHPSGNGTVNRDPNSNVPKKPTPTLQLPNPQEVRKQEWKKQGFKHEYEALKLRRSDNGLDFFVNIDHPALVTEMSNVKEDPRLVKFWFKWGLTLAALGMVRDAEERKKRNQSQKAKGAEDSDDHGGPDLEGISAACDGLARAIIPMIRTLHDGPGSLAKLG